MLNWNFYRDLSHAAAKRWWHNPATGEPLARSMGEMMMLITSELSEAMEGERKNLMDDHLPNRRMAEVEMADAAIRICDCLGRFGVDVESTIKRNSFEFNPIVDLFFAADTDGARLMKIVGLVSAADVAWAKEAADPDWATPSLLSSPDLWANNLVEALVLIEQYCTRKSYDLRNAMVEKMHYNSHRKDHTDAARLEPNGKRW